MLVPKYFTATLRFDYETVPYSVLSSGSPRLFPSLLDKDQEDRKVIAEAVLVGITHEGAQGIALEIPLRLAQVGFVENAHPVVLVLASFARDQGRRYQYLVEEVPAIAPSQGSDAFLVWGIHRVVEATVHGFGLVSR